MLIPPELQRAINFANQIAPLFVIAASLVAIATFLEQRVTSKTLKRLLG